MVEIFLDKSPNYRQSLTDNWSGMAIGWVTPSNLGWDAYRAIRMSQRFGAPSLQVTIILIEKLLTLSICLLFSLMLFPLFFDQFYAGIIHDLSSFILILALPTILYFSQSRIYSAIYHTSSRLEGFFLSRWFSGNLEENNPVEFGTLSFSLPALLSAIPIAILALIDYSIISAMDVDISIIQTLFAVSILSVIFALPISFGSLGVRESSYIIVYSQFGLTNEQALTLSILNLSGILLNASVGAIISKSSLSQSLTMGNNSD
tara:strand:+ start:146 stop:928 length:783 start_codon:yes stop_codon:yes gene_type:complete